MLGFSTAAELRLAVWAAIALSIAGLLLFGKYEKERADGIVAKDNAARSARQVQDLQLAQDIIRDLRNQLSTLAVAAPAVVGGPPPAIRVREPVDCRRPQATAGGTQPAPADSGGNRAVLPVGDGSGGGQSADLGPGMQDLARAGVLLATYRAGLWEWSVKQAQPQPK